MIMTAFNSEQSATFVPINFIGARRYSQERLGQVAVDYAPTDGTHIASPELTSYFFSLQGAVEKQGPMNYQLYATQLWERLIGSEGEHSEGFRHFEGTLISSLHDIDMSKMVYSAVTDSIAGLVKAYGDTVRAVGIWSTGDVTATGYQLSKVERSGVREAFFGSFVIRSVRWDYVRNKTFYMVHDDKFSGLTTYVAEKIEAEPDAPLKVVIIEDSVKNFAKARVALDKRFGSGRVNVVPVWFTGSREGQAAIAKAKAGGVEAQTTLEKQKSELHGIDSFNELLDIERFGDLLADGHIMLDFDGVVGDNIAMRVEQARVTYNALLEGAQIATGMSVKELAERFEAALPVKT